MYSMLLQTHFERFNPDLCESEFAQIKYMAAALCTKRPQRTFLLSRITPERPRRDLHVIIQTNARDVRSPYIHTVLEELRNPSNSERKQLNSICHSDRRQLDCHPHAIGKVFRDQPSGRSRIHASIGVGARLSDTKSSASDSQHWDELSELGTASVDASDCNLDRQPKSSPQSDAIIWVTYEGRKTGATAHIDGTKSNAPKGLDGTNAGASTDIFLETARVGMKTGASGDSGFSSIFDRSTVRARVAQTVVLPHARPLQ